jgi:hypothetical protein
MKKTLSDYRNPPVSIKQLDLMADTLFSVGKKPSYATMIFAAIKLTLICAYIYARYKLIDKELEIAAQKEHTESINDNREDVNLDIEL